MSSVLYFFLRLLYIPALLCCVFTLVGFVGKAHWLPALLLHFKTQYTFFQAIGLLVAVSFLGQWFFIKPPKPKAFIIRHALIAILLLGCLVYNLQGILPYYGRQTAFSEKQAYTRPITLMHINIFAIERKKDDVIAAINENKPDIIDFVEYTPYWQKSIETPEFLEAYPYHTDGKAHMAIYSKFPIQSSSLFYNMKERLVANHANLLVKVKVDNEPLSIIAVHPPVPAGPKASTENQAAFHLWAKQRKLYGKNLVIIGDFNNTPWTPTFQQVLKDTDLRDSSIGFGVQPTWPMFLAPLGVKSKIQQANGVLQQINFLFTTNLFRIPIDHALTSPSIRLLQRSTGPSTGSDHLPLTLRFDIAR